MSQSGPGLETRHSQVQVRRHVTVRSRSEGGVTVRSRSRDTSQSGPGLETRHSQVQVWRHVTVRSRTTEDLAHCSLVGLLSWRRSLISLWRYHKVGVVELASTSSVRSSDTFHSSRQYLRWTTQVSCAVGTKCLLPCVFSVGSNAAVHWRKSPGEARVHSFYNNQDQLQNQHQDYRDRTFVFQSQIHRGNASLQLSEVKVQDAGTYVCATSTSEDVSVFTVKLKVTATTQVSCAVGLSVSCPVSSLSALTLPSTGGKVLEKPESTASTTIRTNFRTSTRTTETGPLCFRARSTEETHHCSCQSNTDSSVSTVDLKVTEATQVSCAVGTKCLLPCVFSVGSNAAVHWRKSPGEARVHSFYNNQDQLQNQHQDYRDRTFVLQSQIHRGNASLQLSEVKVQDAGTYVCATSSSTDSSVSTVNLKVTVQSRLQTTKAHPDITVE
ncbi:hypothetical protein WMY93_029628 [Mugilogobius chulae]|uniref:Ig-like domain-containing protein n=1 Tax=Mugilogobius chulae TaxID=88201 RepID=A0AAW0MT92_9GOBI